MWFIKIAIIIASSVNIEVMSQQDQSTVLKQENLEIIESSMPVTESIENNIQLNNNEQMEQMPVEIEQNTTIPTIDTQVDQIDQTTSKEILAEETTIQTEQTTEGSVQTEQTTEGLVQTEQTTEGSVQTEQTTINTIEIEKTTIGLNEPLKKRKKTLKITMIKPLTDQCLVCLCKKISLCHRFADCTPEDFCGMFNIGLDYWIKAGNITLYNEDPTSLEASRRCRKNPDCATDVIKAYTWKFRQDCNSDGSIDCHDYVQIHHTGGCSENLSSDTENYFKICMNSNNDFF